MRAQLAVLSLSNEEVLQKPQHLSTLGKQPEPSIERRLRVKMQGVAPTDVFVVLHEPPMDNWGIRGGQMASEVDLGFEVWDGA